LGATDHMTGNQMLLKNYRTIISDQYFMVANDEQIKIKGWGIISIFQKKFLQDVFYVENCSVNLLSINKLFKELNCEIIFKGKIMIFQDLVTKELIGEGHLENVLYILDSNKSFFNHKKDDNLSELWHKRVGHPSDKILNSMFNFSINYYSNCEVCKLTKLTKLPFCNSNSNSNESFELIHSDVWGPASITSYNDFRYFIIFINIFSKNT
jgi:GAG-pre-integrase domain